MESNELLYYCDMYFSHCGNSYLFRYDEVRKTHDKNQFRVNDYQLSNNFGSFCDIIRWQKMIISFKMVDGSRILIGCHFLRRQRMVKHEP